ncbi:hypothetical protein PEDI_42180 [Persicobacter diffluens]|uniref:Uncharacterized protein n=1 Tax=Persicobacter diffluens TaxID=981 RepID=A0AAN4W0Z3_9BACT|nr:hypothetical protein PEDI_42180 [Persicobacter diffluens]
MVLKEKISNALYLLVAILLWLFSYYYHESEKKKYENHEFRCAEAILLNNSYYKHYLVTYKYKVNGHTARHFCLKT